MVSLIQSRTNQVCHTCIEDGEFLLGSLLYIQYFGYQRTALSYHRTSQFEVQCLIRAQFQLSGIGSKVALEIGNGLTVRMSVVNTQATADIDVFYQNMTRFQFILQFIHTVAERDKIAHIQYLRTDMEVQADEFHVLHLQGDIDHLVHILHTDTEFVFSQTGSDISMRMCSYIRIDAESDISNLILCRSQFIDDFQFGNRLYIETEDAILQSEVDLPVCFTDSGKNNLIGRKPGTDSGTYFSTAHAVGSHSAFTDNGHYFRIGICLDSIVYGIARIFGNLLVNSRQCITQHFRIIIIERCLQSTEFIDWKYSFHHSRNLFS